MVVAEHHSMVQLSGRKISASIRKLFKFDCYCTMYVEMQNFSFKEKENTNYVLPYIAIKCMPNVVFILKVCCFLTMWKYIPPS